ncbi:aldo/keto reductase [Rhodohalobacter mucosus]|uniref:Aldo/keto reductase n=1 Tax=Rhodohalobacter mucosus TaxID=2079485 RepID=A0A316TQ36_9BACT|nr:aldo/keto reductase [Rhodohalobacter mucosus]PWN06717.1 aldo/keto reductase [Rhodohalobacter mucosus]
MNYRTLGKTGYKVSEIGLGTWQVGGKWGSGFDDQNAEKILNEAIDEGINFIDTADVYENGRSEHAVGKVIRSRSEKVYIATKCGRFIDPHVNEGYRPDVLRGFVEQSLKNTGLDRLDLVQLHCPPPEVYYRPEIFAEFEKMKEEGKIGHLGVSVQKVEEALKAIEYSNVGAVQIIFNMFRHRPSELFFREAKRRNVGIIARVPLASGLLTGKFDKHTEFESGDHRHFNREGEVFDRGETFSGIDYETGLEAVDRLRSIFSDELNLVHIALKWILMFDEVSTVIPGVSKIEQLYSNLKTLGMRDLTDKEMEAVKAVYDELIRPQVHHRW